MDDDQGSAVHVLRQRLCHAAPAAHTIRNDERGALKSTYPDEFQDSSVDLLGSMIFCSRVKGPTESVPLDQQRRLYR